MIYQYHISLSDVLVCGCGCRLTPTEVNIITNVSGDEGTLDYTNTS